jgi:hypothetical protein
MRINKAKKTDESISNYIRRNNNLDISIPKRDYIKSLLNKIIRKIFLHLLNHLCLLPDYQLQLPLFDA